ncbi:hypothetical protein DEJ49_33405 [Streptomyces venezuelae]|uniref:Uncharacterized protein n=1 Tax=Streptomyces venezuelae TaxID=54571 RepID=A0A5P2CU21_STRVZ|nr:hypothetical protein [Streptomyces venezuelae]QES45238.1 hypothetical protein DEJ49_33405 [Streptomyces venezuelae]
MNDPEFIADLVRQLADGWEERAEYHVPITRHTLLCQALRSAMSPGRRRHAECACQTEIEARAQTSLLPSLLDQLQDEIAEPAATTGGPKSVDDPHSNPPGNQAAFECLLGIKVHARAHFEALRRVLYPDHGRREAVTVVSALRAIPDWCAMANDSGYDELVFEIKEDLRKRVRTARIILGYEAPQRLLETTVCGGCGGALIVAEDASTDVRCIGTPEAPGCGQMYRRWDWINLLEGEGA